MINCYLLSQASAGWICVLALWHSLYYGVALEINA